MTVRVNKPEFNLREKLSELTTKFGLKGTELARAETVQDTRDLISSGRKNLVINGDLRIWQRSTSDTINNAASQSVKTADRWNNYHSTDGVVTESRSTDVPIGSGFYYSLKHEVTTADTSVGATQYHSHKYDIEGQDVAHLMWGTSQAKPITVSFWAKSSVTGDYGFCIRPGSSNDRFYADTITITQANSWKKYSFTVPGCLDGTWDKTINSGLQVQISHMMGTTYQTSSLRQWTSSLVVSPTSQVNWMETVGNTWYITGLQVEEGRNTTEFEHRPIGEELALCQRYCQKFETGFRVANAYPNVVLSSGDQIPSYPFTVSMRAAPSISPSTVSFSYDKWNATGGVAVELSAIITVSHFTLQYLSTNNGNASLDSGYFHGVSTESFTFSSEI
jgi:hypothetical protein